MPNGMRKYYFFHPLLWYAIGYCIWMLVPPFFTEQGHHSVTVLADILGIGFLLLGTIAGSAFKNGLFANAKVNLRIEDEGSLVLAFALIVYGMRMVLYSNVGIYAFLHPYSRESSLSDTVSQALMIPYVIFLLTMWYTTRKKIYLPLLLGEVVMFVIPTMARSYYIMFPLYYFYIALYYGEFRLAAKIKAFAPLFLGAIVFIALLGPYIGAVRSYAMVGEIESGLQYEFVAEEKSTAFIIDRLNVHGGSFQLEPVIRAAAELDMLGLKSMFNKWFGYASDYEIRPTDVSHEIGKLVGYGDRTSTDFPRNYILLNYDYGPLAVAIFNFLSGAVLVIAYKVIFKEGSKIFLMLWVPFIFAPGFGEQGAFASTFIFQYAIQIFAFVLLFLVFFAIKHLRRLIGGVVRTAASREGA